MKVKNFILEPILNVHKYGIHGYIYIVTFSVLNLHKNGSKMKQEKLITLFSHKDRMFPNIPSIFLLTSKFIYYLNQIFHNKSFEESSYFIINFIIILLLYWRTALVSTSKNFIDYFTEMRQSNFSITRNIVVLEYVQYIKTRCIVGERMELNILTVRNIKRVQT